MEKYLLWAVKHPIKTLLIAIAIVWIIYNNMSQTNSSTPAVPETDTPQVTTSTSDYDPIQKWGEEKVASANKVMALANQDCKIYEEGPHLVVEMQQYVTDQNLLLGYVRAIADADMVLHGTARNIYFYNPSNKKIAQADTLNGIRLTD